MPVGSDPVTGDPVGRTTVYVEDSSGNPVRVSTSAPLPVLPGAPTAANSLTGYQTFTSTTGATTLITVPAGRTWVGTIGAACSVAVAAAAATAGQARAVFTTAGTNVTPAAGTVFAIETRAGANAAAGTVGSESSSSLSMPLTVIAPAGNTVTVQVASTQAGTNSIVDAWASGNLI